MGKIVRKCVKSAYELHNKSFTKEYGTWSRIKRRCYNPNDAMYQYYGARGITVCNKWLNSFNSFLSDVGEAPTKSHSIERIDSNKGYKPSNCRWATNKEQANNKRNNILLEYRGKIKTLPQWCEELRLPKQTIWARVKAYGWSHHKALSTPIRIIKAPSHP